MNKMNIFMMSGLIQSIITVCCFCLEISIVNSIKSITDSNVIVLSFRFSGEEGGLYRDSIKFFTDSAFLSFKGWKALSSSQVVFNKAFRKNKKVFSDDFLVELSCEWSLKKNESIAKVLRDYSLFVSGLVMLKNGKNKAVMIRVSNALVMDDHENPIFYKDEEKKPVLEEKKSFANQMIAHLASSFTQKNKGYSYHHTFIQGWYYLINMLTFGNGTNAPWWVFLLYSIASFIAGVMLFLYSYGQRQRFHRVILWISLILMVLVLPFLTQALLTRYC